MDDIFVMGLALPKAILLNRIGMEALDMCFVIKIIFFGNWLHDISLRFRMLIRVGALAVI
jgi:hypothetical protein